MKPINISLHENNLYLDVKVTEDRDVLLVNLSPDRQKIRGREKWYRIVEIQESGLNHNDHHGCKNTGTQPGSLLRYKSHTLTRNEYGSKLEIAQEWQGLEVTSHIQLFDGVSAVRSWTEIVNGSDEVHPIEYVSSFAITGICAEKREGIVHIPHSTWFGECQWKSYTMCELGYDAVHDEFSMKRIHLSNTGSWGSSEHLPMGGYEYGGRTAMWQIETSASWNWEISDIDGTLYLQISGPSYRENGFVKKLKPGERFVSVPCAAAFVNGGFEKSIREFTKYRRVIRRENEDNEHPSVIFNDYMNCLMGDPTTEKEYPLIDAAAKVGCKYYCIDCGRYSDGEWWDGVGEWLPSGKRFPGGIKEPLDYIRSKGMIPGLWLELEAMGIECPMAKRVPKDWFFQRNGRPVIDHSRYQLDFRNPEVVKFADGIIDRLVNEYGVGYIKMDYNINAGVGTDNNADSAGEGLLGHTRAYLDWLDAIFARYPELVIENCGSGGMRMEYSLLSRHSIQSVTDQTDYIKMAAIACNCMTAVTPEQAAIWSYPLKDGDAEETVFNMVNAMFFRIHQSGHLAELSTERLAVVGEGIAYHKSICEKLKTGLPIWPLGIASMSGDFHCAGVECGDIIYLAVWNINADKSVKIPVESAAAVNTDVRCTYPKAMPAVFSWSEKEKILTVKMLPKTARIFEIRRSHC